MLEGEQLVVFTFECVKPHQIDISPFLKGQPTSGTLDWQLRHTVNVAQLALGGSMNQQQRLHCIHNPLPNYSATLHQRRMMPPDLGAGQT